LNVSAKFLITKQPFKKKKIVSIATLSHAAGHGVNLHLRYVLYAPNIDIIINFTEND